MKGVPLNESQVESLHSDIRTRLEIQRGMAENTQLVLHMELGICMRTIGRIENDDYERLSPHRVSTRIIHEVRRRRQIYKLGAEAMQGYTTQALCERHNLGTSCIERHIRMVKDQMIEESMQRAVA